MLISQTGMYALRAVLYLAEQDGTKLTRVGEIAADLEVPRNYLSKVLHVLGRAGLLTSTRGPHGGFRLRMDPSRLTLQQVVEPFTEGAGASTCLLGRKRCSDLSPCQAHERWKRASDAVRTFFHTTTVQELIRVGGAEAALAAPTPPSRRKPGRGNHR